MCGEKFEKFLPELNKIKKKKKKGEKEIFARIVNTILRELIKRSIRHS